ncbi:MAG: Acylphosphatase [Methanomassiliicoccales archaeon PtaU1.Bin124]|nr:MAG: Acylphosphatase [Methanomassiliicoccales archaeon PtaU1.Bin124]
MRSRAEVRFRGKVQGVHFRDFTRRFARRMNVAGWVRNIPDGSVEAVFEGDGEAINEVIRMLNEEHPYARVDHMDVIWSPSLDEFQRFEIR